MANDIYQTFLDDERNGEIPAPAPLCKECTIPGTIFSIDNQNEPNNGDHVLGIPSRNGTTFSWFIQNPWIRDKTRNFRDTFLPQVLDELGKTQGDAYLAELYAFVATQKLQFICVDDEVADDDVSPAVVGHMGQRFNNGLGIRLETNFLFTDHKIYYASFTSVEWDDAPRQEYIDEQGQRRISMPFAWHEPKGLFPVALAAEQLARHFEAAKANARRWQFALGTAEAAIGVLALIPAVRGVTWVASGAAAGVRYTFAAIEAALAADAIVDGSSRMIRGEGLSIGEAFFTELAALGNPRTSEERGKQVFMAINLAMLTPSAFGGARWLMRRFRRDSTLTVKLDNSALAAEEIKRLGRHHTGEVSALETRVDKRPVAGESPVRVRELHSVDSNASLIRVEVDQGKADYAYMAYTLRERLVAQIALVASPLRMGGRMARVVGEAGEEALAAALVRHWQVSPNNILGYSNNPAVASRFGLKNKSDQGIDMLVWVPPPPSISLRNAPTATMRDHLDGLKGIAPVEVAHFKEKTLLVIEVKATLGKERTPGLLPTQAKGGKHNLKRVMTLIEKKEQGWKEAKMLSVDLNVGKKIEALRAARTSGKIEYMHAQIFFDAEGKLNKLVGNGTGIQLNQWR